MVYGQSGDARCRPWNWFPIPFCNRFPAEVSGASATPEGRCLLSRFEPGPDPVPRVFQRNLALALLCQKSDFVVPWADCSIHREPAFEEAGDGRGLAGGY